MILFLIKEITLTFIILLRVVSAKILWADNQSVIKISYPIVILSVIVAKSLKKIHTLLILSAVGALFVEYYFCKLKS